MLKKIGSSARFEIQKFLDKKVYLDTFVKVDKDWRSTEAKLKKYGY
jgi:GTP-binding protein Era